MPPIGHRRISTSLACPYLSYLGTFLPGPQLNVYHAKVHAFVDLALGRPLLPTSTWTATVLRCYAATLTRTYGLRFSIRFNGETTQRRLHIGELCMQLRSRWKTASPGRRRLWLLG